VAPIDVDTLAVDARINGMENTKITDQQVAYQMLSSRLAEIESYNPDLAAKVKQALREYEIQNETIRDRSAVKTSKNSD
jgi:hypothetical protein